VAGGWRRLHNEELHNLYVSRSISGEIKIVRMRWVGYVARTRGMRNVYKTLVGKRKGKRLFGKPRGRW
jgi:hypothetical protein